MPVAFSDLQLDNEVLEGINALGYEEPTPIQAQAIPPMLAGRDVIAQAQTGTGKTAAFALPIVQRVDSSINALQAVVIVPTRELAVQVAEAVHALGRARHVSVVPIYGGQPYDRQLRALRSGVQVVVGTPGRMMDHIRRGALSLANVRIAILDEADEMLDMGFLEDIEFILDGIPEERQVALFSATIPKRIADLAGKYLRDPLQVTIPQETRTAPNTRQLWYQTPYRNKLDVLTAILDYEAPQSAIVFCRTRREVDTLAEALEARGYSTAAIHGDLTQSQREQQLRAFRDSRAEILVATDLAARGLDIPEVSHVINYDIPDDTDAYIHRVGRTGRMGRQGEAITLVTPREVRLLHLIEQQTRKKMKPLRLPTPQDIAARRLEAFTGALRQAIEAGEGVAYEGLIEGLEQQYPLRDIARAAVHLASDGPPATRGEATASVTLARPQVSPDPQAAPEHGMTRIFLDAGRKQGLRPPDLLEAFSSQAGVAPSTVGTIDLYDSFAFVDVRPAAARKLIETGTLTVGRTRVQVKKATQKRP